jgi:hypothetical protein
MKCSEVLTCHVGLDFATLKVRMPNHELAMIWERRRWHHRRIHRGISQRQVLFSFFFYTKIK